MARKFEFKVSLSRTGIDSADSRHAEYEALTDRAGFRLLDDRMLVRVTGDDRLSFFHGMCSADVKGAHPGDVLPALFLTEHAHLIGDFLIWVEQDSLTLETEQAAWPGEKEHLEKLLVADDVEMEEFPSLSILHIEGPSAADALVSAGIAGAKALQPWQCAKSANAILARIPRFGGDAFSLLSDRVVLTEIANLLAQGGAVEVTEAALEVLRVEHGIAKTGVDTSAKTIALEARLERAISFNKGCYLGQETIERATARGSLKKKMLGLHFARAVEPGSPLFLDGKEVGRVSSAVQSPRLGAIGLAILHYDSWTPGTALVARTESGDVNAVVSEIPFDR